MSEIRPDQVANTSGIEVSAEELAEWERKAGMSRNETRTEGGIVLPYGDVPKNLRNAVDGLTDSNQKFLVEVKEKVDLDSLKGAIMEKYLELRKVARGGVIRYNKPVDNKTLSSLVMDGLASHYHRRYLGMGEEQYNQLKEINVPASEESYVHTLTQHEMGVDLDGLTQFFKANGTTIESTLGLTTNLGNKFYQRTLGKTIKHEYGDDIAKYRTGYANFRDTFSLGLMNTDEKLNGLGVSDILSLYIDIVGEAMKKLEDN